MQSNAEANKNLAKSVADQQLFDERLTELEMALTQPMVLEEKIRLARKMIPEVSILAREVLNFDKKSAARVIGIQEELLALLTPKE